MLGRLGFYFLCASDIWHQCQMNVQTVFSPDVKRKLPYRFKEREPFYISYGSAEFYNNNIQIFPSGNSFYKSLNLVSNMGHHLNRLAQIITSALFANYRVINPSRSEIIFFPYSQRCETFIMSKVQIRLSSIIGNIDLTVLEWAHCARIDIEVGIYFLNGDFQAPTFQETPN